MYNIDKKSFNDSFVTLSMTHEHGLKLGRGLGRDEKAPKGVGVRLKEE